LKLTRRLVATSAALLTVSPAAAVPQKKAAVDWTRTVVATPEGGFRMGNPQAKVKLVEYGSLTCPHCRHFAQTGMAPLRAYVKGGKLSFEYRNYILNGLDVAATLVARCGGAPRFFPVVDRFYANQTVWIGKINALSEADKEAIKAMSDVDRVKRLAQVGGMVQIAAANGITPAQSGKCLADPNAIDRLVGFVEGGRALGVRGTPTFFVNGVKAEVGEWSDLEPLIKQAGG
jgi:protein-disulfide isomerase